MPIEFYVDKEKSYFISKFIGKISDQELVEDFRNFFNSDQWDPCLDELVDLSEVDASEVTSRGLKQLAKLAMSIFIKNRRWPKIAIYAPNDLPYGLARMYSVLTGQMEKHEIFRTIEEAKAWLMGK